MISADFHIISFDRLTCMIVSKFAWNGGVILVILVDNLWLRPPLTLWNEMWTNTRLPAGIRVQNLDESCD